MYPRNPNKSLRKLAVERRREKATVVLEIFSYSALINNFKRNH